MLIDDDGDWDRPISLKEAIILLSPLTSAISNCASAVVDVQQGDRASAHKNLRSSLDDLKSIQEMAQALIKHFEKDVYE